MTAFQDAKELIINLQDVDSKVEGLSKELLVLFVEVDHELVDVLVYAVREHFAVIPYSAGRSIKVTLKNIVRNEFLGDTTQRMSLFDSFEGSLEQTLFLDGREKFKLHGQGEGPNVPNVKLVYEWRDPDPDPEREGYDELRYQIEQAKATHIETEDRMREIELIFAQIARSAVEKSLIRQVHVSEFKQVTDIQHEKAKKILEDVEEFAKKEDDNSSQGALSIDAQVSELEAQLRSLEESITQEQNAHGSIEEQITSYSVIKVDPNMNNGVEERLKKKEEIAQITTTISETVLGGVNQSKEDNLVWGLEQTSSKTSHFDDVSKAQERAKKKAVDLEKTMADLRDSEALLAKKEFDLDQLEQESQELDQLDRDLAMRIKEGDEALKAMIDDKNDASDRGRELDERTKEYEDLLSQLEKEVNELKIAAENQDDSPQADLFENSGQNNADLVDLQKELDKAENERDEAQDKLENMEGAWVTSIEEVSSEAGKLAGDNKDDKFRKDIQGLLKNILDVSNRSADIYKTLEATDQQISILKLADETALAKEFAKDVKARNTRLEKEDKVVVGQINDGLASLESKMNNIKDEQDKIPPLEDELIRLMNERDELQLIYEELLDKRRNREMQEEDMERNYQRDLANYERRIEEMNREIVMLKKQIETTTQTIYNLRPQVSELEGELETWYEKIKIKREIITKRKKEDELEDEYIPVPTDPIDVKIGNYKNNKITDIPIKRIEEGNYMFATMRAEVHPDPKMRSNYSVKLLRTGKKYDLDDFIRNEANKELEKLENLREDHEIVVDESEKTEVRRSPGSRGGSPKRGTKTSTEVVTAEVIAQRFKR